jgi:hypothetical protein
MAVTCITYCVASMLIDDLAYVCTGVPSCWMSWSVTWTCQQQHPSSQPWQQRQPAKGVTCPASWTCHYWAGMWWSSSRQPMPCRCLSTLAAAESWHCPRTSSTHSGYVSWGHVMTRGDVASLVPVSIPHVLAQSSPAGACSAHAFAEQFSSINQTACRTRHCSFAMTHAHWDSAPQVQFYTGCAETLTRHCPEQSSGS